MAIRDHGSSHWDLPQVRWWFQGEAISLLQTSESNTVLHHHHQRAHYATRRAEQVLKGRADLLQALVCIHV